MPKLSKRAFNKIFQKCVKWFTFIAERRLTGDYGNFWNPAVTEEAERVGTRITRLLIDYTRMDLMDGKADALVRLEHWLNNEIEQLRAGR